MISQQQPFGLTTAGLSTLLAVLSAISIIWVCFISVALTWDKIESCSTNALPNSFETHPNHLRTLRLGSSLCTPSLNPITIMSERYRWYHAVTNPYPTNFVTAMTHVTN